MSPVDPGMFVTSKRGRAPVELVNGSATAFLPARWVVTAQGEWRDVTGSGADLVEWDARFRTLLDLRGVSVARPQGTVGTTAGLTLVPCYTRDPITTASPTWVPFDGGSDAAGGPAFPMATAGFQAVDGAAVDPAARRVPAGVLCTMCVRGGTGSATVAGLVVDLIPRPLAPVTGGAFCEVSDALVWCLDFTTYADADALTDALADPALVTAVDSPVTWASEADTPQATLGSAGDLGMISGPANLAPGATGLAVVARVRVHPAANYVGENPAVATDGPGQNNTYLIVGTVSDTGPTGAEVSIAYKCREGVWSIGLYDGFYIARWFTPIAFDPAADFRDLVAYYRPHATLTGGEDAPLLEFRLWSGEAGAADAAIGGDASGLTEHTSGWTTAPALTPANVGAQYASDAEWQPTPYSRAQYNYSGGTAQHATVSYRGMKVYDRSTTADPVGVLG